MAKLSVLVAWTLACGSMAWAQATYGGSAAPGDGISLKSPKADCPCCEDLTPCPCDGLGAPSWFPTHNPVEIGRGNPIGSGSVTIPGRPEKPRVARIPSKQDDPRRPEESPLPPVILDPSQRPSSAYGSWLTNASFSIKVAPLRMTLDVESGGTFDADRLNTVGTPVSPPSTGEPGGVPPGPVPTPPPPPTSTKSGSSFGDSEGSDDSDTPFLIGPEIAVPLKGDVSEWEFLAWMPAGSSLALYGHVLVGEMEVYGAAVDVELFGLGLGLTVPLLSEEPFGAALLFGAGPGFLRTDLGDTVGVQTSAGIQGTLGLTRGLALVSVLEVVGFFATDARAWGPALSMGLSISW